MKVGDNISVVYHDGRKFIGVVALIEHQSANDGSVWSDGVSGIDRTMIRIKKENGYFQSIWLDKCDSVEVK
jgi:hypothetical protein